MSVLALACAKEPVGGGIEAGVSFSIEVPGAQATKAIGDGETAKKLYYQVFDKDGAAIEGLGVQTTDITGKTATVKFQLVKDQDYNFVFWAQTAVDGYYTIDDAEGLKKITANYTGKNSNDENFDAFYAVKKMTVTGPVSETVKLSRPFAQINIATAGQISAGTTVKDLDFTGATSTVTVKNIPTVFSPLSGSLSSKSTITFQDAAAPNGEILVHGISYKHLAVNYVFAPVDGTVYDVTAVLSVEGKSVDMSVPSAPAKQNWKTNIVGDLLTTGANFDIVVTPGFEGSSDFDPENIKTKAELESILTSYKTATIKNVIQFDSFVSSKDNNTLDIESTGAIVPSSDMSPELTEVLFVGKSKLTLEGSGKIVGPSNSTSSYGSQAILVQGGNVEINGNLTIDGGSGSVANRAMKITNGTAIINGGYFHSGLDKDGNSSEVIFLNPAFRKTAKLYIYGGTFETEGNASYLINMYDNARSSCTVEIYGGKFKGFDPANVNEGTITSFVPDGYKSTLVGEYYVVTKADVTPVADKAGFDAAITAGSADQPMTVELQPNVTVELENGIANTGADARDLTVVGDGTQTFDVITKAVSAEGGMLNYQRGSSFTFKNLTIQAGEGDFDGIVCDALTYENCTIKGTLVFYGKATFINCVFENTMANQYSIRTWGGTDVKFDGCTFNTNGKAILLYGQATAAKPTNLTVSNCEFNDRKNGAAGKAAIEIGNDYNATYNLVVDGCSVKGFANGKNTGSNVWANKNSMDSAHLSVTINGTKVL